MALRGAFESHLEETKNQITRLEDVFATLGRKASGKHCAGIAGIIEEGSKLLKHRDIDGAVRDAGLIAGAQKAEHGLNRVRWCTSAPRICIY